MANHLIEHFGDASGNLAQDVQHELENIISLHGISAQELFYKWESYCIKMGPETQLTLITARDFKKDLNEQVEREHRGRAQTKTSDKRATGATPRPGGAGAGDVFGMMDGLMPNTPRPGALGSMSGSAVKRKSNFETPAAKANKSYQNGSPAAGNGINGATEVSFAARLNAGRVQESINGHISVPSPPEVPPSEPRIKLKANTEMSKFGYKTMAMKLSEASEILDERIEEFMLLVQSHHGLEDGAFGNPSAQSTSEIIAVGRIASDSGEGRLNDSSLLLETSRRSGAGLRVPLHVENLQSYNLFPGKIVALRGTNASGDFFTVTEDLSMPLLPPAATSPADLDVHNARMQSAANLDDTSDSGSQTRPLNILVAAGPYTPQASLDFSALHELVSKTNEARADALVLLGPFLDVEHPIIRNGSFELPEDFPVSPDRATVNDLFRYHIAAPLVELAAQLPSLQIILIPDVRDAVSHGAVAWPQDRFNKKDIGFAGQRQIHCVPNPVTLSLNDAVWGFSSLDVLEQIRSGECVGGKARAENVFERACRGVINQRHFMPVFPPADRVSLEERRVKMKSEGADEQEEDVDWKSLGAALDVSYLKLGEWLNVRPDILVTPSVLTPFAKVVESVLCINPGTLSKRKAPGTYARLTVLPAKISDEERAMPLVAHKMFDRARVDIVKI